MDFVEETVVCRLCLGKFTENCAPIGEVVQHSLNFLTLYPNLTISDNPMMCETCATTLAKCFDFKVRCLSTEDCIASIAEDEDKKVDLRDMYSRVKLSENIDGVPHDHSVCGFCLELVEDGAFMFVKEDIGLTEILQKFFLDENRKITDDILACTPCYNSLQFCGSFVNKYINIEQRIDEYCKVEGLNYKGQVDLKDVETFISKSLLNVEDVNSLIIKEEDFENIVDNNVDVKVKYEDLMDVEQEEKLGDKEVNQENSNSFQRHPSPSQSDSKQQLTTKSAQQEHILIHNCPVLVASYNCEICPFKTIKKDYLRKHMLNHKSAITMYKCELCHHETKRKSCLNSHMLIHKSPSEITMYKCDACDYKTKRQSTLKDHVLTHKSPSEITMYKCETCVFETKYKRNLQQHVLIHMNMLRIQMHKCHVCPFETKWKKVLRDHLLSHATEGVSKCELCDYKTKKMHKLKKHMLAHKSPLEIAMYKCGLCDYKTSDKWQMKRHILIHKTPMEITMYGCEVCTYKTRHKNCLQQHMLVHKDMSEIEMHECDVCSFKTKWKYGLQRHLLSHRIMFKCDQCDYEAKRKWNLKAHMLTHKISSEITMYKCPTCSYETRYKRSLPRHMLIHMDKSKIEMHKCEVCSFKTKWKPNFQKHLLTHRIMPGAMYKCDLCDYEAKQESDLKGHILTHKSHSEITIIKHELLDEVDEVLPEATHTN